MRKTTKALLGVAMTLGAVSAQAQSLTYATLFRCSTADAFAVTATCTYGAGALTLTFTGQPSTTVTAPTNIDFGTVLAASTSSFTFAGLVTVQTQVTQTSPTVGTSSAITGSLSGSVTSNTSSSANIDWSPTTVSIGLVNYQIEGFTPINAPAAGSNTIRGRVTITPSSTVPEPASLALMATGLAAVGGLGLRRRRSV